LIRVNGILYLSISILIPFMFGIHTWFGGWLGCGCGCGFGLDGEGRGHILPTLPHLLPLRQQGLAQYNNKTKHRVRERQHM
jgi:hypothetical protein